MFTRSVKTSSKVTYIHLFNEGREGGGREEEVPKPPEKDNQLPGVFGPRNLGNRRNIQNGIHQKNLERAIVSEQVIMSDVWPPETYRLIHSERTISHEIVDQKNRNTSELLTYIYTRLITNLEKHGFSPPDATMHAANFRREYSYQLQGLISMNTEPQVLKKTIQNYVEQYRGDLMKAPRDTAGIVDSTLIGMASPEDYDGSFRNPDPVPKPPVGALPIDADLFGEEDHEFDQKIIGYAESVRQIRDYEREYQVSPEEVVAEKVSPDHLDTLRIPPAEFDTTLADERIDSPESIASIPMGESEKVQLIDESGVSDVMCTHLKSGGYILQFQTGESIRADTVEEIAFIQEIAKTPIIRRLLMNGNGKFQDFRVKFEKEFPGKEIDTNPDLFTKKVLERILSKIPDEDLNEAQRTLKENLASMFTPDVSLARIQEFLRNMRDQLIPMLHKTGLIPRDGVQKLYVEKLL